MILLWADGALTGTVGDWSHDRPRVRWCGRTTPGLVAAMSICTLHDSFATTRGRLDAIAAPMNQGVPRNRCTTGTILDG